jgi:hypothetical protein
MGWVTGQGRAGGPQDLAVAKHVQHRQQEARATAALSHPNILAVYDIGSADGRTYVVSELLEGETLREAMSQPVTPSRALQWAVQIAFGLAAAHSKRIVHRDIKRENLFVRRDGRITILDFGLARVATPSADAATAPQSPTMGTEPGMVMGTAGYMSPEQVRGVAVDERSDIFSLGVVIYEMVSGRRPFAGASAVETMNAILTADPAELEGSGRPIPPALDRIVRRCLEKRPEDRFHSAHDLALALEAVSGSRPQPIAAIATPPVRRRGRAMLAASIALVAVVSAGAAWWWRGAGAEALPTMRRITFRRGTIDLTRFEPGTTDVAYSARWQGAPPALFSVHPESPESRAIGQVDAMLLAVSPRQEAAVILSPRLSNGLHSGTLATIPLGGGGARELATRIVSADFTADGTQLAAVEFTGDTFRVSLPAGHVIYQAKATEPIQVLRCAPRGGLIALGGSNRIVVIDPAGSEKAQIKLPGISGMAWSPDGSEIWYSEFDGPGQGTIFAAKPGGRPRKVWRGADLVLEDIATNGTVLVVEEEVQSGVLVQRTGSAAVDFGWLDGSEVTAISPNGDALLLNERGAAGGGFYVRKLDASPAVRLGNGHGLAWSPKEDAVLAARDAYTSLVAPVGPGTAREIPHPGVFSAFGWFAPDGRMLINGSADGKTWQFSWMDESGKLQPARPEALDHWVGQQVLSHDGRLIAAYPSGQTGKGMVAIYPIDGGSPQPVRGLDPIEVIIQFAADDRHLLVYNRDRLPAKIFELDYRTGQRTLWREFTPSDPAGIAGIHSVAMTADRHTVAFNYTRSLGTAYLISGLR